MARGRPSLDLSSLLASVYKVAESPRRWMDDVLTTAVERMNLGAGVGGVLYDVSSEEAVRSAYVTGSGTAEDWVQAGAAMHASPEMIARVVAGYRSIVSGDALSVTAHAEMSGEERARYLSTMNSFGVGDEWLINGRGAGLTGAALYLFSRKSIQFSARQQLEMRKLAQHLGTALRLQQRIAAAGVVEEAQVILDRRGHIQHLSQGRDASKRTAARLGEAARADTLQRLSNRRWGRGWRFFDYVDGDDKAFVILCRDEAASAPKRLSRREQEVVARVARGASDKEVAHDLGIAASTVRVLLARAGAKLGATTKRDLIARLKEQRASGEL